MTHLVLFSPERIALQKELVHHPELIALLQNHPADEFEIRLAEIAAYCGVLMDGNYLPHELDRLCGILVDKLMAKRCLLLLPSGAALH